MERTTHTGERQGLLLYLVIANLWTWALWIPALLAAISHGFVLPSPDNYAHLAAEWFVGSRHIMLAVVFSLAVYGPLIGACAAIAVERGARGVSELLAATYNTQAKRRWYLVALAIAAAIAFMPAVVG